MDYKSKPQMPIIDTGIVGQGFLTAKEAADYLRIKLSHLYNLTSRKMIKFYRPQGKLMYFLLTDLNNWVLNNEKHSVNNLNDINHEAP